MEKEKRFFLVKIERRAMKNDKPVIAGYAAVFNKRSENLGGFVEEIAPNAFTKALKKSDARALINHDSSLLLGRQSSGTLRLKQDDAGLYIENDPPNTSYARDLLESIDRGDISEMSFGFTVKADKWDDLKDDVALRTITEFDEIFDVSPVTFPAYPDTTVALRSLKARKGGQTAEPERFKQTLDGMNALFDK